MLQPRSPLVVAEDFAKFNYIKKCMDAPHTDAPLAAPGTVPWDPINWPVMAAMLGICYMVSIELLFRVLYTLRDLRGMYFYSLVAGGLGCIVHITGSMVQFFIAGIPWWVGLSLIILGWWGMIIGQSLVLYSRLGLVVESKKVLWALRLIVGFTFVAFLVPCPIALILAKYMEPDHTMKFIWGLSERAQLFGFMLSEMSMNATYILATWRTLQTCEIFKVKKVVRFLIVTNVAIILMDAVVITMEIMDWYTLQATLKPCVYALKFKFEFAFLNQLYFLTKEGFAFIGSQRGQQPQQQQQLPQRPQLQRHSEQSRSNNDPFRLSRTAAQIVEARRSSNRTTSSLPHQDMIYSNTSLNSPTLNITEQAQQLHANGSNDDIGGGGGGTALDHRASNTSSIPEALPQWHTSGLRRRRSIENITGTESRLWNVRLSMRNLEIDPYG